MNNKEKVFLHFIFLLIAIVALTISAKLSVGIALYDVQMDNKKLAEETARITGWTDRLKAISDEADKCIEESPRVTVQLCRLLSDDAVIFIAVLFLVVGIFFVYVTIKVTLVDIKYILKRSKRKRRV